MNRKILLPLFLIVFGIYLSAGAIWSERQRPTGDEPHYLIMAQSLIKDHDFDLKNNYDQSDYSRWGYPAGTLDRAIAINSRSPHQYPVHGLGWPLVLAPVLALGHLPGLKILTALIATLLFGNIFLLIFDQTKKTGLSLFIAAILGFSPPLLIYSTQIFNELFTALLTLYAFRQIISEQRKWYQDVLAMLAMAFLPWIHIKYLLMSVVLLGAWLILRRHEQKRWLLAVIFPASLGLLALVFWHFYGSISPSAQYPSQLTFALAKIGQGFLGLFLDRTFGLLPFAPVYLFAIAGFYFLFRYSRRIFWLTLAVFLSLLAVASAGAIYIGWAPEGRFLVPILPLLALPLAFAYLKLKTWSQMVFWFLTLWGLWVGILLIRRPDLNYSLNQPVFANFLNLKYELPLIFPKLITSESYPALANRDIRLIVFWLVLILLLNLLVIWPLRRAKKF